MSIISTDQIIIELCKETGEPGLANNQTLWGCVLDGIRDLNIHSMPTWDRVDDLCLNNYNAVEWPDEVVKPLITYLIRNGRPFVLDINDELIKTIEPNIQTVEQTDQSIQDFYRLDGAGLRFGLYNIGIGEIYGLKSYYNGIGLVTHDKARRQSFIHGVTLLSDDTIGMFFKTDGLEKGCFVPAECKEAIEYFALSKYYRTRNPSLGAMNRQSYQQEVYRLERYLNDEGLGAWKAAINSNITSSPKF